MKFSRRGFTRFCLGAFPLLAWFPSKAEEGKLIARRRYQRVRLVNREGNPVHTGDLVADETYVFHYPFHSTPCFLINLGQSAGRKSGLRTEDGQYYEWPGGVGPEGSVVAYSAICAHMMTYPARKVSFINYYGKPRGFTDSQHQQARRAKVIFCCSEKSVYDAAQGAKVLGGPAPQPLAVIDLQHSTAEDQYYAGGTLGGEMFEKFFESFGYRLALEYGREEIQREVRDVTPVVTLAEYCDNLVRC